MRRPTLIAMLCCGWIVVASGETQPSQFRKAGSYLRSLVSETINKTCEGFAFGATVQFDQQSKLLRGNAGSMPNQKRDHYMFTSWYRLMHDDGGMASSSQLDDSRRLSFANRRAYSAMHHGSIYVSIDQLCKRDALWDKFVLAEIMMKHTCKEW